MPVRNGSSNGGSFSTSAGCDEDDEDWEEARRAKALDGPPVDDDEYDENDDLRMMLLG